MQTMKTKYMFTFHLVSDSGELYNRFGLTFHQEILEVLESLQKEKDQHQLTILAIHKEPPNHH